ncbi:MAG: hypothetical protein K8T91_27520 [Planctomycetes bacterium]|nr:hypothetical protein [Planctomycetota bacterium]
MEMQVAMNLIVASREEIEHGIVVREPYGVVSISDPGSRRPKIRRPATFRGAVYVKFHDAEPVTGSNLPPEVVLINQQHVNAIWRFVEMHRLQLRTIVVHCEQGMSRSPAVAAGICDWLDLDASRFFSQYQPNQYVYKLLRARRK